MFSSVLVSSIRSCCTRNVDVFHLFSSLVIIVSLAGFLLLQKKLLQVFLCCFFPGNLLDKIYFSFDIFTFFLLGFVFIKCSMKNVLFHLLIIVGWHVRSKAFPNWPLFRVIFLVSSSWEQQENSSAPMQSSKIPGL